MFLDYDSEHVKSPLYHRLINRTGDKGWRPVRLSETIPPTERTLKILTKEEAEQKKQEV